MESPQQYQARLWQADFLNNAEYARSQKEQADLENPARIAMRREIEAQCIRSELKTNRAIFLGWRKVLKTQPAYAKKHGHEITGKFVECARVRRSLHSQLKMVQA